MNSSPADDAPQSAHFLAVYRELRSLAAHYLYGERPGHTLQPTALVHEAYLRLAGQDDARFHDSAHFARIAALAMRRVLIDHARARSRGKRGGGAGRLSIDDQEIPASGKADELVALDEALDRLAEEAARSARVVELRYFGGYSADETAAALGVSLATVKREWAFARAWLARELES